MNRRIRPTWERMWLAANAGFLILSAPLARAGIALVNTGSLNDTADTAGYTKSFDASGGGNAVDKLLVSVGTESNPPITGITYHGTALTLVPGSGTAAGGRNRGIWILDNPYPGGAADLIVSGDGTPFSQMRLGIASISGSAVGASVASLAADTSVALTVPVDGSFVFAAFAANSQAAPTAAAPLNQIFAVDSESSAAGAGYVNAVAAGPATYSFTGNTSSPQTSAVVLVPADARPVTVATSPADDETNVAAGTNLVATFSQPVMAGSGTITLRKTSDDSTVESFDVATSGRLAFNGAELTIDPTSDLANGVGYHVLIDPTAVMDVASNHFAGVSDPATWNFTTRPGLDTIDGRLISAIQANIDNPWPGISNPNDAAGVFPYALACLFLNQNVGQANDLIANLYTNNPIPDSDAISYGSYFWQHILWRIHLDPAMNARLAPATRGIIESNMWRWLRTRSTLAEAGKSEWTIQDSENHDAMQKGSHLMCLVALKNASGYGPGMVLADGGTLAQHLDAWTGYFIRYFRSRAKEGINVEIASPIYAKYSVGAYYNIMDFADSPALRNLAAQFITLYWADTASDWTLSGVRGGGETRCYKDNYLRLGTQYSFHGLLWAYGWHQRSSIIRTYPLIPAVSSYRVPAIITACARDPGRPNFLYSSRRFGRGGAWNSNRDYTVVFDSGNSSLRRDTFVTPDYSMGTFTVDMNKDYIALIDQNRAMGVMFATGVDDRVMVFGKGGSDPDKSFADISGVTRENCMVVQRDPNASQHGNATLVFLRPTAWNNRVENGGWFFTQLGNAYCAIKPAGGGYTAAAASQGYELTLGDLWAPVVIQMGQASDYAGFADFQTSVMGNPFTYVSGTMNYTSEAGDAFTFHANTKTTPKVNGTTVNLNPAKTYDSPYLSMVHGEEVATFSYPGYPDLLIDFGDPPALLATDPADDATGVALSANLVATFSKPVAAGSGAIVLRRASDDSTVEAFDVATSPRLGFAGVTVTINPTAALDPGTSYYVTIDSTAVEDLSGNGFAGLAGDAAWNFTTNDGTSSPISVVNSGNFGGSAPGPTVTQAITVGAEADMLVVMTSAELGNLSGDPMTVTYGGVAMNLAVGNRINSGIWYLDLSTPGITGTDVVVDMSGYASRNGFAAGWLSINGNLAADKAIALHGTGTSAAQSNTVDLTATVQTFDVVNFNGNNTSGTITVNSPNPTVIYTDNNIGSARSAAAYVAEVEPGTRTYRWTISGLTPPHADYRRIDAAAFAVVPAGGGNNYADWIANYPGVGGQTGINDDPDGDGVGNGVENFFGTDPGAFSPGLIAGTANGNTFTFTHPQGTPADDLTAAYRWSTDLTTFHGNGETDTAGTRVDFSTRANTPEPGLTTVAASVAGTSPARLFLTVETTSASVP